MPPMVNEQMPRAPFSMVKPLASSVSWVTASRLVGLLTSIICKPSPTLLDTRAYVALLMVNVVTPHAPSSSKNVLSCVAADTAVGLLGSLTSITCTPSPILLATIA